MISGVRVIEIDKEDFCVDSSPTLARVRDVMEDAKDNNVSITEKTPEEISATSNLK